MPIKKRKPTARKSAKRKTSSSPGASLKRYTNAMKKGTATITRKIVDYQKKIEALKKLKKQKIKVLTKKYKK